MCLSESVFVVPLFLCAIYKISLSLTHTHTPPFIYIYIYIYQNQNTKTIQIRWYGADRVAFLERIVVSDIAGLAAGSGCLSLVTDANGGILDDTVITNAGDHIYMVVNGATKHADMQHFQEQMVEFKNNNQSGGGAGDVTMEYLEDSMQLLALQGPGAAAAVAKLLPSDFDLTRMAFMTGTNTTLDGIEGCRITR